MAGIGDSWGTREELLHPRGPDGRWIRKGGIAKNIIGRILEALANFRPRMFQSQGQANQYLKNVASKKPARFQGGRGYGRLLSDLGPTNEDLRDGVIDNPSTKRFVGMMDQSATELPDDVILTRHVGVEAFGFTPQTAQGTNSDTDPGIRGMSGKLVADRGYSTTTIGEPRGAPPQGSVRMVIAARKGTKVMVPGSGENDSTVFLDRDQPLRITKIEPDGSGGWVMYALTDEKHGATPEPIGGPVGAGTRDTKQREADIARVEGIRTTREKQPDEAEEQADFQRRREATEAARGQEAVPSPAQEAERRRVEQLQQQAGVQPRTEPIQARSIGGEPRPEQGATPAPTAPEAPTGPRRAVDLRLAVRDAGIPSPTAGPNRKRFNDAYEGIISGKKDPIDAARELDRDAADLRAAGDEDADNLEQLSELIKREYGLEQPAPAKKAAKAEPRTGAGLPKIRPSQMQELDQQRKEAAAKRAAKKAGTAEAPEAPSAPPPVPEPAKAPAKKAAGRSTMTRDQEDRVIARAQEFRGNIRNSEEQRIVDTADEILARRQGGAPAPKLAPAKAAKAAPPAPTAERTPEQEIKGLFGGKRPTNAQLRQMGEDNNLGFGPKEPRSEMIQAILGARPTRGRQRGELTPEEVAQVAKKAPAKKAPAKKAVPRAPELEATRALREDDLDRMTKAELLAEAERREVTVPKSWTKDKIKAQLREEQFRRPEKKTPEQRREQARESQKLLREFEERVAQGEGAPTPAKKAAKAAVPGAAPGTAAGKITAGRLQPGMRILVDANTNGHTNRKTGSKVATVTSIDRFAQGGRTRSQTRIQINAVDEDGRPFIVGQGDAVMREDRVGFSPSQTFMAAPEPGAAPAKKAAKAAAPKRMTIGEARRLSALDAIRANEPAEGESNSWKTILSRVNSGDWTVARARKEAKDSARYWREQATTVRRGGGRFNPDKVEEAASRLDRAADTYDKLAEDLTISQSVTKTDKYMNAGAPSAPTPEPAAPSAPETPQQIMQRLEAGGAQQLSREEAAELVAPLRKAQLQELAKELNIPRRTSLTAPELKRAIVEATVGRRLDSVAIRGFTGARPGQGVGLRPGESIVDAIRRGDFEGPAGHPGDTGAARMLVPEQRDRQVKLDRVKAYGTVGTEVDELLANEASPRALAHRIRTRGRQQLIPDEDMAPLIKAAEAGDNDRVRALARGLMDREGITQIGNTDEVVALDRENHQSLSRGGLPSDTSVVHVVRPGSRATVDGDDILIDRAVVEPASPEEISAFERARRRVPEGSVAGDRPQVKVTNEPRKRGFDEAWDAAELDAEGSPGRSMKEIREDVSSGKITPEEGIRRMEDEIAFNKEDLAEVDANLRQPDLTDEERAKLQTNAAVLTNGIEAQEKASKFMRMYFRDEKPTVEEIQVTVSQEEFEVLERATPESLREAAKEMGLRPPKGETKKEIMQDLVLQVAEQVARDKGITPKKAPAKKGFKAAKKAAAPAVPVERERIDARLIGAGIDFNENDPWTRDTLNGVQAKLDAGDQSPAAIGRELDESVRSRRTTNVYEHGSWHAESSVLTPEERAQRKAENQANYDRIRADTDRMEELATRLKATRRKPVKKAAAPEVRAAEKRADNAEARLINERLEQVNGAKSRDEADKALDGLTMQELRRIAESAGLKGRSKRDLRDKILDHFGKRDPNAVPPPPTAANPPEVLPTPAPEAPRRLARGERIGERAKAAGIERPSLPFSGVNDAEGEANRMLQRGESPTAIARMLRERAAAVAKADLNEEGRRFRVEHDKNTLQAARKANADYLRRLGTMLQQDEKKKRVSTEDRVATQLLDRMNPEVREQILADMPEADRRAVDEAVERVREAGPPTPRKRAAKKAPAKKAAPRSDLGEQLQVLVRGTSPEERAGTEAKSRGAPVRTMRASGTDIYDRADPRKPLKTLDRPKADEPVYLPNGGNDQGRVHMDSELGGLWLDLYYDEREPNSFVNEIAKIGEQVGTGQLPLAQALQRLARMKGQATDEAVADRIQRAIDGMDAPPMDVPDLPDTVPGAVRRALQRLSEIPTARRTQVGPRRLDRTILEEKADIVRQIDAGEIRVGADRALSKRDLHESGDGALEMWRIFERLMIPQWVTGYRQEGGRTVPIESPNPDWPEIQAWLRGARERAYARQKGD